MSKASDPRAGLPSASSMDRYAHCPGSWSTEAGLPELPTADVTQDGTDIHEALETGDDSDLGMTQKEIATKLKSMEADAVAQWMQDFNLDGPVTVIREERLWVHDRRTLDPLVSAQLDVGFQCGNYGLVLDFKTGFKGATPSEVSWQSRVQTIAFWQEKFDDKVQCIRAGFAASRLASKLDTTDYAPESLQRVFYELQHVLWRIKQPNAPRVPGAHCRYCRAQSTCPEAATFAMLPTCGLSVLKKDQLSVVEAVQRMTPQDLALVHSRKSLAESIFKMVDERIRNLSEADLAAAGLSLGPPRKTYPMEDEKMAHYDLQLASLGLTPEQRLSCYKIVRGRVDELVAEKLNITKKDATQKVIDVLGLQPKEGAKPIKEL